MRQNETIFDIRKREREKKRKREKEKKRKREKGKKRKREKEKRGKRGHQDKVEFLIPSSEPF